MAVPTSPCRRGLWPRVSPLAPASPVSIPLVKCERSRQLPGQGYDAHGQLGSPREGDNLPDPGPGAGKALQPPWLCFSLLSTALHLPRMERGVHLLGLTGSSQRLPVCVVDGAGPSNLAETVP